MCVWTSWCLTDGAGIEAGLYGGGGGGGVFDWTVNLSLLDPLNLLTNPLPFIPFCPSI